MVAFFRCDQGEPGKSGEKGLAGAPGLRVRWFTSSALNKLYAYSV